MYKKQRSVIKSEMSLFTIQHVCSLTLESVIHVNNQLNYKV